MHTTLLSLTFAKLETPDTAPHRRRFVGPLSVDGLSERNQFSRALVLFAPQMSVVRLSGGRRRARFRFGRWR